MSAPAELRPIVRHAGTVLVGQLAVMAFGVTDTIVAGRHSESALAALSVGSAVFISVFVALMGVLQALLPIWAEQHGGRRHAQVGRSVRQALYLAAIAMVIGVLALLSPGPVLRWTGVPAAMQDEVRAYLAVLALALPPALLFRMYSTLNQALGKPLLVTWLQIGALLLKIPLTIWFALGGGGLEAHGAVGCAAATLVVNTLMAAVALWMVRTQDLYRPYAIWRPLERPDWHQIGHFARMGIPGGLAVMVEVTSFTLMALFIARLGNVASAAHQIASNLAAVLYMVPLSLGIATSARTSYWIGAGRPAHARHAAATGLRLAALLALGSGALVWLASAPLARLYAAQPAVVALAAPLLAWVALYHVADAVQAVCMFVLRCYRITLAPLVVYCVLLWGLGLSGGYWLAYEGWAGQAPMRTPTAFWVTSAVALAITSALFALMLLRATHPRRSSAAGA